MTEATAETGPALKIGDPVRNVKTKRAGVVAGEQDQDTLIVEYSGEDGNKDRFTARRADLEHLNEGEMGLVKRLVEAKARKSLAEKAAEEAGSELAAAEDAMVEYFRTHEVDSTKVYDGVGKVAINGMRVYASIPEDMREQAFADLESIGRGEVIKRTIHPSTLNSLVNELMDIGKVPPSIKYFLKPKLSITKK